MKLSIIIVNYNDRELTLKLLDSIYKQTDRSNFEIVLVDNGSREDEAALLKAAYPEIKTLAIKKNHGFSPAVNFGIRNSRSDYILLLNPDITFQEDSINVMLRFLEAQPKVGAVGCKIRNTDGTIQQSGKSFPSPLVFLFVTLKLHKIFPNNPVTRDYYHSLASYEKSHQVESLMASCLMLRRSMLDKVGLMDENFILYCDDVDWCYRMHKAGYSLWYLAETEVLHKKGGTINRESYKGIVEYHKSAWHFYKKWYYDRYPKLLSFLFFIGLQLRKYFFLVDNFFSREKKVKY